ncbi:dipeptide epimerase [Siculibacillus lacustris]|uniref:Dipeptide epimerase n=1 Tax=Siculibacillus lacustris TaxID=1549641 RepID=A0A4Q9VUE3_9HYPH|nr:N-acetyl-D-Glu racemase DgcA [Siculibacillus lacustris]TBW38648.1 dipeptide epimerase [Siculibacillus lacustris]
MTLALDVAIETFPIAGSFTIARGSRTEAVVVTATITDGRVRGRGECVPYARYGETVEGVAATIRDIGAALAEPGFDRAKLARLLPAGAARNALDCALWDFEAKRSGVAARIKAGVVELQPLVTAYTLSLGSPESMAAAAAVAASRPLLKVKLGGEGDPERIAAVREAAPEARMIVDANEAWRESTLAANLAACEEAGVELIEQPLPAGEDDALIGLATRIAVCADESLHEAGDLAGLRNRYTAINIKLDKAGGLTEALHIATEARRLRYRVMVGCMVGTSLAMAPALLVAQGADFVDLDGPLLLARDRHPGLVYDGSLVAPPLPALWG